MTPNAALRCTPGLQEGPRTSCELLGEHLGELLGELLRVPLNFTRPPFPSHRIARLIGSAMHSHPYGEGFGSYFEIFMCSLSVACVNVSPETVFFDGPRAEGSTVR